MMRPVVTKTGARIGATIAAAMLAACSGTQPEAMIPPVAAPPAYATDLPPSGIEKDWWLGYDDPVLDALVRRGLAANLDIDAAADRLGSAAALLRAERSDRVPSLDGAAEAGVSLSNDSAVTATAGLFGSFDPDLDGRLAAEIRAAAAAYAEAEYLLADQGRLVAAAIASQYIEYRRTGAQLELLEQSTDLQEQTLRIVTLRFEAGLAANLDVRRAAADLAQTQARRGLIDIARNQALNALAILLAEPPGVFSVPAPYEPGIPNYGLGPPAGVPADLLRRRTDILAAEARLAQAAAAIGIEQADLRPSLTIPGTLGIGDGSFGGLFTDFLIGIGAALDLPLFDGGRRRAEVAAAEFEAQARIAEYRSVFLDAQRQLIASRQSLIDSEAALATSYTAFHAGIGSD